ncbi:hypothetical protein G9H72_08640 [Motilibacter sp. K478]|nr:hypothetical protein [Motilibacter aurantiacus]
MLDAARAALGEPPLPPDTTGVSAMPGLGGPLPVDELACGAVLAQLLAARRLNGGRGPVELDARHVGFAFRSERHVRLDGVPAGAGFAPWSRFWRTADGWLRLHANYPHHERAARLVLGEGSPDAVAAAMPAEQLEAAVVAAGGAAAAVRSPDEWARHPQGATVARLPLLSLTRVADAPARAVPPSGPRVLDLTRVIAGPVATRTLAAHGADVLRVDSPHLPELPGALLDTGPGKRHTLLDLAASSDRGILEELLRAADVLALGYRPGALDAHGLGAAALAARHPHLVVVRLSAWGTTGPWRHRRGFDSLVQAATGIATAYGDDERPGVLPAQALDHGTGHLAAAVALTALARRRDEGGTWHGELSLAQTAHWLTASGVRATTAAEPAGDVTPYLVTLPSPLGRVTVVAPPGAPAWVRGPVPAGHDRPQWEPAAQEGEPA